MSNIEFTLTKQVPPEEQALKDTLSENIRKYRQRRNWSQFTLAAKANISTNFIADIEAGNTWVSAQTLVKIAQALDTEAFELLKPQKDNADSQTPQKTNEKMELLSRFSQDLTIALQESTEKALNQVKKQYEIDL